MQNLCFRPWVFTVTDTKIISAGDGARWLRAVAPHPEVPSLIPSTYVGCLKPPANASFKRPNILFSPP